MESAQNLKRRMKSVQNIGTITKAMELVAATKMRRSQELALDSRPYAYAALELLGVLSGLKDVKKPALFEPRPITHTAFLVVTSDKGLAGSFNSSVFRKLESYIREHKIDARDRERYSFVAVGQKAKTYLEHRGMKVAQSFVRVGDFTRMEEVEPISRYLTDGYLRGEFDQVIAFATNFVTALRQEVLADEIFPITYEEVKESIRRLIPEAGKYAGYLNAEALEGAGGREYLIEPSPAEALDYLAAQLVKVRVYHLVLEANASEHSARRVAMKNASDNAAELSADLNIEYNKSRQAAITSQIIEVTSGAQAIENR